MLSRKAADTNFIVFGLTWPELEPTIYRTQGEHPNHYTTNAGQYNSRWYDNGNLSIRVGASEGLGGKTIEV